MGMKYDIGQIGYQSGTGLIFRSSLQKSHFSTRFIDTNTFENSGLSSENEERIAEYCKNLKEYLQVVFGGTNYRIVPVVGLPYSVGGDLFTTFSIRSASESPIMKYILSGFLGFSDFAKDDQIVLINVSSLVDDVNQLKAWVFS